ncbi:MAG: zinc ribbon domain-containing protein [Coriobacteriia bacterium]|nr:zinc ribbon domain-containing protein [Coriobacteriia bacterium]
MNNLFSSEVQIGLFVVILVIVALYVLSIIWTMRDAYARGAKFKFWGLIALIPFAGVLAYVLMRPPLLAIDKDEQELEIALKQRQLMKYGECSRCGFPVKDDYFICPNCGQKLKNRCSKCGKLMAFNWKICAYCGTPKKSPTTSDRPSHVKASSPFKEDNLETTKDK